MNLTQNQIQLIKLHQEISVLKQKRTELLGQKFTRGQLVGILWKADGKTIEKDTVFHGVLLKFHGGGVHVWYPQDDHIWVTDADTLVLTYEKAVPLVQQQKTFRVSDETKKECKDEILQLDALVASSWSKIRGKITPGPKDNKSEDKAPAKSVAA